MTLPEYITSNLNRQFEWANFDCVTFASRWVSCATGVDPLAGLPKWRSEKEARRVIRSVGGLEKAVDARLKRINPNFAVDGDLGIHNGSVGIFSGSHLVGPGPNGLIFINRLEAECAWSLY